MRCLVVLIVAPLLLASCCHTTPLAPTGASSPTGIKYVENKQDAGIVYKNGVGYVNKEYLNQYVKWYYLYGSLCNAPENPFSDAPDNAPKPFIITDEGAQDYETMNRASKSAGLKMK